MSCLEASQLITNHYYLERKGDAQREWRKLSLRSGNDCSSGIILRSGNDDCDPEVLRCRLRSGNDNMNKGDLAVRIKRSERRVKLVVRLKAIEYKRASPAPYLPTPSAKPFPSSMP